MAGITASNAKACVEAALQGGDPLTPANWFSNPVVAQQVQSALATCTGITRQQGMGIVIAHSSSAALPVQPNVLPGQPGLASLLGLIGALNSAAAAQFANAANNSQPFDLVNNLVTYLK